MGMEATTPKHLHYDVNTMMVRTQISLPPDQHRLAKRRATEQGVSLAEYLRQLIARDLGEPHTQADVTRLFALGESGRGDVAGDADAHLGEILEARRPRRRP
jgi:hypothetical protein